MLRSAGPILFLALSACDASSGAPDAALTDAAAPMELVIGTAGTDGAFVALSDGDRMELGRTSYDVPYANVSLRAHGATMRAPIIELEARRTSDDVVVSQPFRVRVSLVEADDGARGIDHLPLYVPDDPEGERTLVARVIDEDTETTLTATREVVLVAP